MVHVLEIVYVSSYTVVLYYISIDESQGLLKSTDIGSTLFRMHHVDMIFYRIKSPGNNSETDFLKILTILHS